MIILKISPELFNYDARIVSENVNTIKQIIACGARKRTFQKYLFIIDLYFASYQSQKWIATLDKLFDFWDRKSVV